MIITYYSSLFLFNFINYKCHQILLEIRRIVNIISIDRFCFIIDY